MRNITLMLLFLLGAFAVTRVTGASTELAGRVAITALFGFTALGHFANPARMAEMLPPGVPARRFIVLLSGALELIFAIGILLPATERATATAAIAFLFAATPLNIYAAFRRVKFGGHGAGPRYLLIRLPLQAALIVWVWWFGLPL